MSGSVFGRIAATMLVPMIALGAAAALAFRDATTDLDELEQTQAGLDRLDRLHGAARAVGHERLQAALAALPDPPAEVTGDRPWEAATEAALAGVDGSTVELERAVEAVAAARSTPVMRSINYGRATVALLEAAGDVEVVTGDAEVALGVATVRATHHLIEETDRAWIGFAERSSDQDRVVAELLDAMVVARTVGDQVVDGGEGTIGAIVADAAAATAVMDDLRVTATEDLLNRREEIVTPDAALVTLADARERWDTAAARMELALEGRLNQLGADAETRRNTAAVLGLFAVLAIGGAGMVLHGTLTGPVEVLAGDAEHFAEHGVAALAAALATPTDAPPHAPRLAPGPGLERLADAVNRSHDGLYHLAVGHARSRHHLAGRAVTLLDRNTKLLHALVRLVATWRKADGSPEVRARLFQIDHLASRMQRNAEALLLLGGGDARRRWAVPVSATDTVRVALGELSAFDRVDIEDMASVRISGEVAPDVAHLLAELIENALNAADPRKGPTAQRVVVNGLWVGAGFAFTVGDQGRGIADEDRADMNRRLHTPVASDDGPTEFLGLHIVAHLAQRHGIDVRLLEAPAGGTVSRVTLPVDLIDPATVPANRKPIDAGRGTDLAASAGGLVARPTPTRPQESAARTFFGDGGAAGGDTASGGTADGREPSGGAGPLVPAGPSRTTPRS